MSRAADPSRRRAPAISRLEPIFEIKGASLTLHTGELAAIRARLVSGAAVADLSRDDYAIREAIDMLCSGL